MPRAAKAPLPVPRLGKGERDAADRKAGKMPYRLQVWREASAGFVTLAGYYDLDRALEAGPLRGGHVRVVAGKAGRVVISWLNGNVRQELEER